jgi:hypothetical protein
MPSTNVISHHVLLDSNAILSTFPKDPLDPRKFDQKFKSNELAKIREECADGLKLGPRTKAYAIITDSSLPYQIVKLYVKIGNGGKRDGIRVYGLLDKTTNNYFVLGFTSHSRNENDLTDLAKKQLFDLVLSYKTEIERKKNHDNQSRCS